MFFVCGALDHWSGPCPKGKGKGKFKGKGKGKSKGGKKRKKGFYEFEEGYQWPAGNESWESGWQPDGSWYDAES
eukprot:8340375-Karenia_brevis.AAC.1